MTWTLERTDRLKKLWAQGYSGSQIASDFGNMTRNQVIGKAYRMGLYKKKPKREYNYAYGSAPHVAYVETAETIAVPAEQRKSFAELTSTNCRWPIGDPQLPGFFFCGAASDQVSPYCAHHHRRARA